MTGRGECVPYARYGESVDSVVAAIEAMRQQLAAGLDRVGLQAAMKPGAARNALDCAFWDLEAKHSGRPAYQLAGLPAPRPLTTAFTISLATPAVMAEAAAKAATRALLKIKLGGDAENGGDPSRIAAVRAAAPKATLIVDANEGWNDSSLGPNLAACAAAGVVLVEQPLPEGRDQALAGMSRPIPVCADESVHDRASLSALGSKYDAVNIKLDKTGGLTEALAMAQTATQSGFIIFAGCMVATSLSMAPAVLLAQTARFADLDGPLLLARDRDPGLRYDGSLIHPPAPALWG
jgi:L-alanine-DL-glutamate epimerase-like enolase superfamily enzyme